MSYSVVESVLVVENHVYSNYASHRRFSSTKSVSHAKHDSKTDGWNHQSKRRIRPDFAVYALSPK